jgi:hypothetical protein
VKTPEEIRAKVMKKSIINKNIKISKRSSETFVKLIAFISFETSLAIAQHKGESAKILNSLYCPLPVKCEIAYTPT